MVPQLSTLSLSRNPWVKYSQWQCHFVLLQPLAPRRSKTLSEMSKLGSPNHFHALYKPSKVEVVVVETGCEELLETIPPPSLIRWQGLPNVNRTLGDNETLPLRQVPKVKAERNTNGSRRKFQDSLFTAKERERAERPFYHAIGIIICRFNVNGGLQNFPTTMPSLPMGSI